MEPQPTKQGEKPVLLQKLDEACEPHWVLQCAATITDEQNDEISLDSGDTEGSKSVYRYDTIDLDKQALLVRHLEMPLDHANATLRYARANDIDVPQADIDIVNEIEAKLNIERRKLQLMIRRIAVAAKAEWAEWGKEEDHFPPELRL